MNRHKPIGKQGRGSLQDPRDQVGGNQNLTRWAQSISASHNPCLPRGADRSNL